MPNAMQNVTEENIKVRIETEYEEIWTLHVE